MPIYKLEQWREKADAAVDSALKERGIDPASVESAAAMQRIGELSMALGPGRLVAQEVAVLAEATARRYGVARVCQICDQPRSSFYAARQPQAGVVAPTSSASARRGPKPSVRDEKPRAAEWRNHGTARRRTESCREEKTRR